MSRGFWVVRAEMQNRLTPHPQVVVESWEGYLSWYPYMHYWRLFQQWAARLDQVISLKTFEGTQVPGRQQLTSCAVSLLLSGPRVGTGAKSVAALTWWTPLTPLCWLSETLHHPTHILGWQCGLSHAPSGPAQSSCQPQIALYVLPSSPRWS